MSDDNVRNIGKAMHDKHLRDILKMLAHTNPKAAIAILGNCIEAVFVFINEVDGMPKDKVKSLLSSFLHVLARQVTDALDEVEKR